MKDKRQEIVEIIDDSFLIRDSFILPPKKEREEDLADEILSWHESEVEKRRLTVEEMSAIILASNIQGCGDPGCKACKFNADDLAKAVAAAQERKGK